ncbi:MAG: heme biosynthesis protein HemY [Pseudomonadota bacterium]
MKRLFLLLVVILAAAGIAAWAHQDPGYVFISREPWSIELSLSLAVALLGLAFVLLYLLIRLIRAGAIAPRRLREWRRQRRALGGLALVRRGEIELAEGRWRVAERHLARAGRRGASSLIAYLGAARAAQRQHAHRRRDAYLRRAHESEPEADQAVLLTQAELQIAHRQHEEALASLMHLRSLAPRHGHVLALLARLYREMAAWDDLLSLFPSLRRRSAMAREDIAVLEREARAALLQTARQAREPERLRAVWAAIPREQQNEAALLLPYVAGLHELGADDEAEPLLRKWLKRNWDSTLVRLYGCLETSDTGRQLTVAERWLGEHDRDPDLLLALGRLARRHSLWGKARGYLETSINSHPSPEAYRELGELLEEEFDEREAAMDCYRKGLQLAPDAPREPVEENQSPAGSNASA